MSATSLAALRRAHDQLTATGARLLLTNTAPAVRDELDRYGISALVGVNANYPAPTTSYTPTSNTMDNTTNATVTPTGHQTPTTLGPRADVATWRGRGCPGRRRVGRAEPGGVVVLDGPLDFQQVRLPAVLVLLVTAASGYAPM